jgi:hypothetical protein
MASVGQGQAIVLDNPRDPLAIYGQRQQREATNAYRDQQLQLRQRGQQQTNVNRALAHKYQEPGEKFKTFASDILYNANNDVMSVYQNNPDVDPIQLQGMITKIQGDADRQLSKTKEVNDLYSEKSKLLTS